MKLQQIVVGYDETPAAERALERAADLAKAFGAKVTVTSVAPIIAPAARGVGPYDPIDSPALHQEQLAHARAKLADLGLEAELVEGLGDPAGVIVELSDKRDADLIVVGTREPGLIERLTGGSVSGKVEHKTHRDVLIVH